MRIWVLFFFILAFPLSSFGIFKGETVGYLDTIQAWKFTARLLILDASGNPIELCTGTLIHKQVVLTAAHCIKEGATAVQLYFGLNPQDQNYFQVVSFNFVSHPGFVDIPKKENLWTTTSAMNSETDFLKPNLLFSSREREAYDEKGAELFNIYSQSLYPEIPKNDLALIFLDNEVPEQFEAIKIADSSPRTYGVRLSVFGFGLNGLKESDLDENLRTTDIMLVSIAQTNENIDVLKAFPLNSSNICVGDSGGPAVVDGELVGILSAQNNDCHGHSYFAAPAFYLAWIKSLVPSLNDSATQY